MDQNIDTLTGDLESTRSDRTVLAEFSTQAYRSEFLKQVEQKIEAAARRDSACQRRRPATTPGDPTGAGRKFLEFLVME